MAYKVLPGTPEINYNPEIDILTISAGNPDYKTVAGDDDVDALDWIERTASEQNSIINRVVELTGWDLNSLNQAN